MGEEREKTCWQCGETYLTAGDFCPEDGARLVELSVDESRDWLIGQTIGGRYEIHERLGEGGMGTVYAASDPERDEEVAIKVLKAGFLRDENIRRRFMHEARIVANLEHPNVVRLHDFGQMPDGNFYMVMELLEGESLADQLAYKFLSFQEIFSIIPPICEVLQEAHSHGVIHRDLKPENIFIVHNEDGRQIPRLIDFGVAKQLQRQTMTRTGMLWGTPAYMSPEQVRGDQIEAASDIYAMGTILYELVCGHLPFQANTQMGYALKHMHQPARPMRSVPGLETLPQEFDELVLGALSKDPAARPESMARFVERLRQVVHAHFRDQQTQSAVPAQLVDPGKLERWIAQGEEQLPEDASLPEHLGGGGAASASSGPIEGMSQTATPGRVGQETSLVAFDAPGPAEDSAGLEEFSRPVWPLVAAGGAAAALIVIVALAGAFGRVLAQRAEVGAPQAEESAAEPGEPGSAAGSSARISTPGAGDEAAGLAASSAARTVIRAQSLTQIVSQDKKVVSQDKEQERARPRRARPRGGARSRGRGPRPSSRAGDRARPDDVKDALRKTF